MRKLPVPKSSPVGGVLVNAIVQLWGARGRIEDGNVGETDEEATGVRPQLVAGLGSTGF